MPELAIALALGSAFLHALWNVLIARPVNSEAAMGVALPVGVLAFAPVAALHWQVSAGVIPYLVATWGVVLVFYALLAAAYRRSDLSLVYPISRGSAPVFVLVASILILSADIDPRQALGVLTIAGGVLMVRGLRGGYDRRGAVLGLAVAACIAGYTLIDRAGLQHAHPLAYVELAYLVPAIVYPLAVSRRHGWRALRAAASPSIAFAAVIMFGAYAFALGALTLGPPASVAAIRESSVVIATALAAMILRERVTRMRAAGSVLVVVGIITLAG